MEQGIERKVIAPIKGICNVKSDLICEDDELEVCEGLTNNYGELQPIQYPKSLGVTLPGKLSFVHTSNDTTRYISVNEDRDTLYGTYGGDGVIRGFFTHPANENYTVLTLNSPASSDLKVNVATTTSNTLLGRNPIAQYIDNTGFHAIAKRNIPVLTGDPSVPGGVIFNPRLVLNQIEYTYSFDNGVIHFKISEMFPIDISIEFVMYDADDLGSFETVTLEAGNDEVDFTPASSYVRIDSCSVAYLGNLGIDLGLTSYSNWDDVSPTTHSVEIVNYAIVIPSGSNTSYTPSYMLYDGDGIDIVNSSFLDADHWNSGIISDAETLAKYSIYKELDLLGMANFTDLTGDIRDFSEVGESSYFGWDADGLGLYENSGNVQFHLLLLTGIYWTLTSASSAVNSCPKSDGVYTETAEHSYTFDIAEGETRATNHLIGISEYGTLEYRSHSLSDADDTTIYIFTKEAVGVEALNSIESSFDSSENLSAADFVIHTFSTATITSVTAVGKTLCVSTTEGLYYFVYKLVKENNEWRFAYFLLGNKLPEPHVEFFLEAGNKDMREEVVHRAIFNFPMNCAFNSLGCNFKDTHHPETGIDADQDVQDDYVRGLYAQNKEDVKKNYGFCNPFFVRYAIEMTDGSYVNISNPILLLPSINANTLFFHCCSHWLASATMYSKLYMTADVDLSDWEDLIKGVVVFASDDVDIYDTAKHITNKLPDSGGIVFDGITAMSTLDTEDTDLGRQRYIRCNRDTTEYRIIQNNVMIGSVIDMKWDAMYQKSQTWGYTPTWKSYMQSTFNRPIARLAFNTTTGKMNTCTGDFVVMSAPITDGDEQYSWPMQHLVRKTDAQIMKELSKIGSFYHLADLGLEPVTKVELSTIAETNAVLYLTDRPRLEKDDYFGHTSTTSSRAQAFNRRLNMFGLERNFFEGFDKFLPYNENPLQTTVTSHIYTAVVEIQTDSGYRRVVKTWTASDIISKNAWWFFYPDPRAKKFTLYCGNKKIINNAELTEHTVLNGAYYFSGLPNGTEKVESGDGTVTIVPENAPETINDYIVQSEVDNPMAITAEGYVKVGDGKILGIAGLTTALSQDAYAVATTIVFTTKGIWAVKVNDEGVYTSVTPPFSREVCTNPDSITMTDHRVFFVSAKGLMCVTGIYDNNVQCVSEQLRGKGGEDFIEFLQEAKIAYDYEDKQLIIYKEGEESVWVYNMQNDTFSTKDNYLRPITRVVDNNTITETPAINTAVADYPDYLIQDSDKRLYSVIGEDYRDSDDNDYSGVIESRPMKLGGSALLKSIHSVKNLLMVDSGATVKLVLKGSNDLKNWHTLVSIYGKPFRFYKYRYEFTNLKAADTFSGILLDVQKRNVDRPH